MPLFGVPAQVREKSEANTRTFNYLGKKRDRETPFLEGAPNGEAWECLRFHVMIHRV